MASSFFAPSESQPTPAVGEVGRWEGRLFGAFRLLSPDGVDATPSSRKARALVAYLLAAADDGATRDRLAGLFWSERGEDQARASLRQTFYEIRALTSGDAPPILIDRTRVALVASRVMTDVSRLEEAARADDAALLAAVVGPRPGEFLADLDGIDPVFDDWLSIERMQRRDARRRALMAAAERRLASGDAEGAQRLADCLIASDATDEAAACLAMEASQRSGDRDGVRRIFAALQVALRRQVDVGVSAETDALYRRLIALPTTPVPPTSVGPAPDDRAVRSDEPAPIDAPPSPPGRPAADDPAPAGSAPARRSRIAVALVVVLALVALVVAGVWRRQQDGAGIPRVLLVEPIQVKPDDPASGLRVGFAAEVARQVVRQDATLVVRDTDRPPDAAARGIVAAANATSDARSLHVDLRLYATGGGPILWSTTFARPRDQLDALREQMATKLADVVTCALGERSARLDDAGPQALRLMLGACDLRRFDGSGAGRLLTQLTTEVPDFAHGWALLASVCEPAGQADAVARRAIELDPHDGGGYLGRTCALDGLADWSKAVAVLRDGERMAPDDPDIAMALALALSTAGYEDDAVAASERAVRADPFSPTKVALHATLIGMNGDPVAANAAFHDAQRRFFNHPDVALADFRFQALAGDHQRAAAILNDPDRGFNLQPDRAAMWRALLAWRAAPSPDSEAAAVRAFTASMAVHPDVSPGRLETLVVLHRVDDAYVYADRLRANDDYTNVLFNGVTRPLRADPRFMTLAARIGLVKIWRESDRWPDFCRDPSLPYDCRVEAARALSADARPLGVRR